MDVSEVRQRLSAAYDGLDQRSQEIFLTKVGYWLTLSARDTFVPGTNAVEDGERLRAFSEATHRVLDQLSKMVTNSGRHPDEVFANILVDNVQAVRLHPMELLAILTASLSETPA